MTPAPVRLHPLTLTSTSREEVVASLVAATAGRPAGTVILDAALLGPRVAAERRVVEVLARAGEVVAERAGTAGIVRVTRAWGVELLDAGALDVGGTLAFPPDDPAQEARALRETLEGLHGVELASRAGLAGPVRIASAGTTGPGVAGALALTDADAVFVEREPDAREEHDPQRERDTPAAPVPAIDARYDAVRAALGVRAGTAEAVDIGLPRAVHADDVEHRIARACRLALRPFPEVSQWHPVRRHVRTGIDPSTVDATVLQIGVRLDAPDDLVLGAAIGRLVVALAAEGVSATPIQHEDGPRGRTALVAFLGDTHTAPDGT